MSHSLLSTLRAGASLAALRRRSTE